VGYLPLDTLKQVDRGIWTVNSTIAAGGLALPTRMTVMRLTDGGLLLHSPTRFTADLGDSIEALGPVRHLVAPTFAHWLHLAEWRREFPEAITWGVPGLRERPQVVTSGTRIDRDLTHNAPPDWESDLDQVLVHGGGGFSECAFFHRASRTLVLCDLIENLEPAKLPPVTRLLAQAFAGTRGTTALHVRAVVALGGARAKAALQQLVALSPQRVLLSHGAIFEHRAADRIRQAFEWRV
jgi:hypothetical protein